jgi:hypothetical protein
MNPLPLLAGWQAEHQHHGLCPHLVTSYTPVSPHFACVSGTTSLFLRSVFVEVVTITFKEQHSALILW